MKLKFLNFFLLILLLIEKSQSTPRQCKTEILRSFGLHSRLIPNRNNPLCPSLGFNCCTKHDQMKIHKVWTEHTKINLNNYYKNSLQELNNFLSKFVAQKDQIEMKLLISKFEKETPKPSAELIAHLKKIQKLYEKKNTKYYNDIARTLMVRYKSVYHKTKRLRQSFYCGMCNWHNLDIISPDTLTINYNNKFCTTFIKNHIDVWADKYTELINLGLLLDEFVYLISNFRIIKDQADRALLHKYKVLVEKCEKNQGDKETCGKLCKEYNVNKFSYLVDGEAPFFKSFLEEFGKIIGLLTDEKKHHLLFKNRRMSFMTFDYNKFKKHTILQKDVMDYTDPKKKIIAKGENPIGGLKLTPNKSFIEKIHPTNTVQIETLDDQVNTFTLYRMIEEPIDISKYTIVIQGSWGYNPYKDAKHLNMDEPVEKFIALLHTGGKDANALSEILETSVEDIIKELEITDISNFVNDNSLEFRKVVKNNTMLKLKALKDAHNKKKLEAAKKAIPRNLLGKVTMIVMKNIMILGMIFGSY